MSKNWLLFARSKKTEARKTQLPFASMYSALTALTDELRRLKASGVKTVVVSEESLASLRKVVAARALKNHPSAPALASLTAPAANASAPSVAEPARVYSQLRQPAKPAAKPAPTPKLAPPPIVTLPEGDKPTRFAALQQLVATDAECVKHVPPGKKAVLGIGNLDAKIFFCGDAPDEEEETQGEPFVGPAGQLLTKMIQAMGVKREDVYIGTIMNWRPAAPSVASSAQVASRPPSAEEIRYGMPYLRAQLGIVEPDIIVALGSIAAQGLLGAGSFKTLGEIRGKWLQFEGKPVIVTYSPSYILRTPTNRTKRAVWEDFLKVMERIELPISEKQSGYFLG